MNRLFTAAIIMLAIASGCSTINTVHMTGPDSMVKLAQILKGEGQHAGGFVVKF